MRFAEELPPSIATRVHGEGQFAVEFFGTHDYAWLSHNEVIPWLSGDHKVRLATHSYTHTHAHIRTARMEDATDCHRHTDDRIASSAIHRTCCLAE